MFVCFFSTNKLVAYFQNVPAGQVVNLSQRLASWAGHAAQADAHRLLQSLQLA